MPKDLTDIAPFVSTGRNRTRDAVLLDFATGFVGFWNGHEDVVVNTRTYYAAGKYLNAQDVTQVTNGSAVPIVISISGIPGRIMTPDVLQDIYAAGYKSRPMYVYKWHFHPTTKELAKVRLVARGRMDTITNKRQVGGSWTITINGESLAMDQKRTLYRMRTDEDQRKFVSSTDRFLQHKARVGRIQIDWGDKAQRIKGGKRNGPARR